MLYPEGRIETKILICQGGSNHVGGTQTVDVAFWTKQSDSQHKLRLQHYVIGDRPNCLYPCMVIIPWEWGRLHWAEAINGRTVCAS